jgi:hypothetical protein
LIGCVLYFYSNFFSNNEGLRIHQQNEEGGVEVLIEAVTSKNNNAEGILVTGTGFTLRNLIPATMVLLDWSFLDILRTLPLKTQELKSLWMEKFLSTTTLLDLLVIMGVGSQ